MTQHQQHHHHHHQPKKVAIIGAGPSGLVTAKTLLCNFPAGTFSPTVFEERDEVGGLWPVVDPDDSGSDLHSGSGREGVSRGGNGNGNGIKDPRAASASATATGARNPAASAKNKKNRKGKNGLDPLMRTNLSRFTVGFSDLAWESVLNGNGNDYVYGCEGDEHGHGHDHGHYHNLQCPVFPQAWQVGRYLQKYVEVYLPPPVLRLGHRVVRTIREGSGWTVYFHKAKREEEKEEKRRNVQDENTMTTILSSEHFDFLVVASGYFSRPHVPEIPGLSDVTDRIVHSSVLHDLDELLPSIVSGGSEIPSAKEEEEEEKKKKKKRLLVIGGSMSGAEAASTLALRLSSSRFTPDSSSSPTPSSEVWQDCEVRHVCTRPFWTLPMYLPQVLLSDDGGSEEKGPVSFLPLDLALYDLSRRPPGPVEYNIGPVSSQQADRTNEYLRSLLGANNAELAGERSPPREDAEEHDSRRCPPWIAISNDYTEFVRSGTISVTIGRASAVRRSASSGLAKVQLQLPDGQSTCLDDVAAIVMATGFEPFHSVSFLPPDILSTLEYSEHDAFCPLILDGGGSCTHSDIPDLGFVGFYRGPYWGVMEMQARTLGQTWAGLDDEAGRADSNETKEKELEKKRKQAHERVCLRALRRANPVLQRGQFPMSDYMGLMESCGRDLGISRMDIFGPGSGLSGRRGPVVPARYSFDRNESSSLKSRGEDTSKGSEMRTTLDSLRVTLSPEHNITCSALALAIFRALHGTWEFSRSVYQNESDNQSRHLSGTAALHPRYPTSPAYTKEYIYEESSSEIPTGSSCTFTTKKSNPARYIYRLRDPTSSTELDNDNDYIHIWPVDTEKDSDPSRLLSHGARFTSASQMVQHGYPIPREYVVKAFGKTQVIPRGDVVGHGGDSPECHEYYAYTFYLRGVDISSWECAVTACSSCMGEELHDDDNNNNDNNSNNDNAVVARTLYQRWRTNLH